MLPPLPPPPPELLDGAALFLDFDGTLVDLAEAPDAVAVPEHLPALLARLSERLEGRLAIVSGRSIERLERFGLTGHSLAGSHGAQVRHGETWLVAPDAPAMLDSLGDEFDAFARDRPGTLVERKPHGVALHYRQAAQHEAAALALAGAAAREHGLHLQRGKMMVELRAAGHDKGGAIARLMAEPPFAGRRPIVLGDDVTDEAGFATATELGGAGVLVGPARQTAARYRLADVGAVHRWLDGVTAQ